MKIEEKLADSSHYGSKRSTSDIKYIVVIDLSNNHSPHYHIANGSAIQIIPDDYMSDVVNGPKLNPLGIFHGICTKYNSISIGIGNAPSDEDKEKCLELIMTIKQRYTIQNENVIRQMDITGEYNPKIWHINDKWERDITGKLNEYTT